MDNDMTDSLSFGFHNPNHAAGRLVREGDKTYRYGYLDKVLSVTDGKRSYRYAYHVDGQLARADYGDGGRAGVGEDGRAGSPLPAGSEAFLWDGLALVRRGDESFVNEPHVGDAPKKLRFGGKPRAKRSARRARKGPRGNPVVSSKGATYFNDALGTTVGVREGRGASRKGAKRRYTAAALTAFGEPVPVAATSHNSNIRQFDHSIISSPFFTGKPEVEGLGRVFLYRNYRSDLAKWQTADPLGYPDGWNQLAYCGNDVSKYVDLFGCFPIDAVIRSVIKSKLNDFFDEASVNEFVRNFFKSTPSDDVHVYGYVSLKITGITIDYNHPLSGDCSTTADDYNFSTLVDQDIVRTRPDIYTKRNPAGDGDGASCKVGDGTPLHMNIPNLSITDSILGLYPVTITRISFDYTLLGDIHSRYLNYVQE